MSSDSDNEPIEATSEVESTSKIGVPEKQIELPKFEKSISDKIVEKFGTKAKVAFVKPDRVRIDVGRDDIKEVAEFVRDVLNFDHAESVSGTDYPEDNSIEVVYHLNSYSREEISPIIFALSTKTDRDEARLPSLLSIFKSVEYHERETFEMLGVYFEGHPRNERFLLPEDWADIPPLRKDFRIKGR